MKPRELTPYETTEIQMKMVVPLLRDLQAILGEEVVLGALRERMQRRIAEAQSRARTDVPFEKRRERIARDFASYAQGEVLEYESRRGEDGGVAIDVTACRFADLMGELDARDLGELLLCGEDEVVVAGAGTQLVRTQTRMQCASHCDFRFCDAAG